MALVLASVSVLVRVVVFFLGLEISVAALHLGPGKSPNIAVDPFSHILSYTRTEDLKKVGKATRLSDTGLNGAVFTEVNQRFAAACEDWKNDLDGKDIKFLSMMKEKRDENKDVLCLKYFIDKKPDVAKDLLVTGDTTTPLHLAAQYGRKEIAELLLNKALYIKNNN